MEVWLQERGYSNKFLRVQILLQENFGGQKFTRKGNENKFILNITYHSVFSKLKTVLSEIHFLSTPDREHGKIFDKVPLIRLKRAKTLKEVFRG